MVHLERKPSIHKLASGSEAWPPYNTTSRSNYGRTGSLDPSRDEAARDFSSAYTSDGMRTPVTSIDGGIETSEGTLDHEERHTPESSTQYTDLSEKVFDSWGRPTRRAHWQSGPSWTRARTASNASNFSVALAALAVSILLLYMELGNGISFSIHIGRGPGSLSNVGPSVNTVVETTTVTQMRTAIAVHTNTSTLIATASIEGKNKKNGTAMATKTSTTKPSTTAVTKTITTTLTRRTTSTATKSKTSTVTVTVTKTATSTTTSIATTTLTPTNWRTIPVRQGGYSGQRVLCRHSLTKADGMPFWEKRLKRTELKSCLDGAKRGRRWEAEVCGGAVWHVERNDRWILGPESCWRKCKECMQLAIDNGVTRVECEAEDFSGRCSARYTWLEYE